MRTDLGLWATQICFFRTVFACCLSSLLYRYHFWLLSCSAHVPRLPCFCTLSRTSALSLFPPSPEHLPLCPLPSALYPLPYLLFRISPTLVLLFMTFYDGRYTLMPIRYLLTHDRYDCFTNT